MPPSLDLSGSSNMLVVPPRMSLRRSVSYSRDKEAPLSSTSSRFSFNHLVFPPPSPGLPPPSLPRPRRRKSIIGLPRPSRVARVLAWSSIVTLVLYIAAYLVGGRGWEASVQRRSETEADYHRRHSDLDQSSAGYSAEFELVGQDILPDFPTPIIFADRHDRLRWTVSIPESHKFPLTEDDYLDMSEKCYRVAGDSSTAPSRAYGLEQLMESFRLPSVISPSSSSSSASATPRFIDVEEAGKAGYLPGLSEKESITPQVDPSDALSSQPSCTKTMTFVLNSANAGLGRTLMALWTAYGIAQKEKRAFFIDDTHWAYGKYTDLFVPPPPPACRRPPSNHLLPCPRQAHHLVITTATAPGLFRHDLPDRTYTDARQSFDLTRAGYQVLFKLTADDAIYVGNRTRELVTRRNLALNREMGLGESRSAQTMKATAKVMGLHVRRGDRHPDEYQYRESYVPTTVYVDAARSRLDNRLGRSGGDELILLASDDPSIYEAEEFAGALMAQDRIRLATKGAIQRVNPDRSVMHKLVDETFGWDGGFYATMFWNLDGVTADRATRASPPQKRSADDRLTMAAAARPEPTDDTLRLHSLMGRAYMMDLAVLAAASDVVACTASATGCRLLAVMMGWDASMVKGSWVNVDGGVPGWSGISIR